MLGLLARIAFCYSVACLQPLSRPIHCQHSCRMPAGIETQLTKGLQVKLILPQIPWKSCTLRTRLGASRLFFTTCHVASWFGRLGPMVRGPQRTHARLQLGVMIKLMLNRFIRGLREKAAWGCWAFLDFSCTGCQVSNMAVQLVALRKFI